MKWTKEHIWFANNYINVKGIGTVGLWWPHYDKKVCLSYGFGESFYANTEDEIVEKVLGIINKLNSDIQSNQK